METVTVNITRASVLADMKVKSHAEVASIDNPKARYLAELGSEKVAEANQCINDAAIELQSIMRTMLTGQSSTTATDTYDTTATISFVFSVTTRKSPGLAAALTSAMHAYVVDSALEKFYISVASPELAKAHRSKLPAEISVIENIIYRKYTPTYQ